MHNLWFILNLVTLNLNLLIFLVQMLGCKPQLQIEMDYTNYAFVEIPYWYWVSQSDDAIVDKTHLKNWNIITVLSFTDFVLCVCMCCCALALDQQLNYYYYWFRTQRSTGLCQMWFG